MVEIELRRGNIGNFRGDAIIVPSDVDLTRERANEAARAVLKKAGPNLLKELSAIGYCEIGNAVITRGYNLNVKHVIFLPYQSRGDKTAHLDFVLLHQALKNAFNLAALYGTETLAIDLNPLGARKIALLKKLLSKAMDTTPSEGPTTEEMADVVTAISGEYEGILGKVVVYR